jgi:subtilisin family serine protease
MIELYGATLQSSAPWGLGSISHRTPGWEEYLYDQASAGEGMWAYVLDTGVNTEHVEFEGRAFRGYNALPETDSEDNQGHGTHCAGVIASRAYGVAKKAKIMAVKVFDTGYVSASQTWDMLQEQSLIVLAVIVRCSARRPPVDSQQHHQDARPGAALSHFHVTGR